MSAFAKILTKIEKDEIIKLIVLVKNGIFTTETPRT